MLITDYSSIAFDFAYMKKPIIYYQFDSDEYYKKHYNKGYFNYYNDGFGEIVKTEKELIKSMVNTSINSIESKYLKNINRFFEIRDENNCERYYSTIINSIL